jgi:hypothetical protein
MSGRNFDVMPQNGDCSRERNMRTIVFRKKKSVIKLQRRYRTQYEKDAPSDNAIRRWVKQFQETEKEQEDDDRNPQKSPRRASLQLGTPQTTAWRVAHNRLHLHACWLRKLRR